MEKLLEFGFEDFNTFFLYYGGNEINYWYNKKDGTLKLDTSIDDDDDSQFDMMPTIKVDVEHCIRIIKTIEQIED